MTDATEGDPLPPLLVAEDWDLNFLGSAGVLSSSWSKRHRRAVYGDYEIQLQQVGAPKLSEDASLAELLVQALLRGDIRSEHDHRHSGSAEPPRGVAGYWPGRSKGSMQIAKQSG